MVELPLKLSPESDISTKFCCMLMSNSKSDDKVIRRLATDNKCTKVCKYKDCKEHLMKYEIRFQREEDKVAFLDAIKYCKDLVIEKKIPRKYA